MLDRLLSDRPVLVPRWALVVAFLAITAAFVVGLWRIQKALDATNRAVASNKAVVAVLCDESFLTGAILIQVITLLQAEPHTAARARAIYIFQGYLHLFQDRPQCVAIPVGPTTTDHLGTLTVIPTTTIVTTTTPR